MRTNLNKAVPTDTKSQDEICSIPGGQIKVKKTKGNISEDEQNKIARIVLRKQRSLFKRMKEKH
jgi:hypothetical protein